MKKQVYAFAFGASLLLAGAALAQVPPPTRVPPPPPGEATPPPPPSDMALPPPAPSPGGQAMSGSATIPTPQGEVTINSGPAPAKPPGPAPDFTTLAGGKGSISPDQASAYPLLANDFQFADSNRDGRVSKAEYQRWVSKSGAGGQ